MNERDIQFAIYQHRRSIQPWPLILTNIYFFGGIGTTTGESRDHFRIVQLGWYRYDPTH